MTTLVEIAKVSRHFAGVAALDRVSLEIPAACYCVLLGPSGSGKTTLLNILGGFLEPSSGAIRIDGVDVTGASPQSRPTTTVFQDYALFPHMSCGDNVGFGLRMRGLASSERNVKARAALDLVGLPDAFGRKPHQLSGGQRQRVALARALVVEPQVLLLDEPLGALDLKLRRQMQDELKALQKRVGAAFVHVTHDQEEAMALADLVVVMNQGRIEDIGPPERVYARPASRFTASFMGESLLAEGRVVERDGDWLIVESAFGRLRGVGEGAPGAAVTIAIRPENITRGGLGQPLGSFDVEEVWFQGAFVRALARGPQGLAVPLRLQPADAPRPGERIAFTAAPEHVVVLNR